MYGSPTTKELKKKHSSRLVGGAEMGSWAERTCSKVVAGGQGWTRLQLVSKEATGRPGKHCTTQSSTVGKSSLKPLIEDTHGGLKQQQEKLPASQESSLERPTGA